MFFYLKCFRIIFIYYAGNSIECYTCRSETDSGCAAETPDSKYLTNCTAIRQGPKYTACRKIENYVDFEVLNRKYCFFSYVTKHFFHLS